MILSSIVTAAITGLVVLSATSDDQATIIRWSDATPIQGDVVQVDSQGVQIRLQDEIIPVSIALHDIRQLSDPRFQQYKQLSQELWRAHSRLNRGDYVGAERIYGSHTEQYLWRVGAQSIDVSFALMRCHLDRNDRASAIEPFLSWRNALGSYLSQESSDDHGFDGQYGVHSAIPPIFIQHEHAQKLSELDSLVDVSVRTRTMHGYYQLALDHGVHRTQQAREQLDNIDALLRTRDQSTPGLEFIEDIVVCQAHPDASQRKNARSAIERRVRAHQGTWIEAWGRLAIGVSLINETEPLQNELGLIELIHVIVRLKEDNRSLAELAATLAGDYLDRTDRSSWGNELEYHARSGIQMNFARGKRRLIQEELDSDD